ncbi:uncharacterized protein LOC135934804 isoform X2 [Cloeon dipterum]|uniref:uncharacterized protein LOC135934804 isoform X2 n=1 Tax=Cloeon dipterum TaxID=197152 RepID=UPI0032204139
MVPPSAPAEDEAEEETAPEAPVPCVTCDECNHDCCALCPSIDDIMWSRLGKCLIVQVLIVFVLVLHLALSSQIVDEIRRYEPRSSDELCSNPACDCTKANGTVDIKCGCQHYFPNISKTFELPFPAIIPENTTILYVSNCDTVKIVKNELRVKNVYFPTWFGIQDVDTLIMDSTVALMGRNIIIGNVRHIPEFPIGILRMAVNGWVESFTLSNVTNVDVVRYQAFNAIEMSTKFVMSNITFRVIEENAFNMTLINKHHSGLFVMAGCTIDELKSTSFKVTADLVQVLGCHFERLQSAVFELQAGSILFSSNFFSKSVESFAFNISATETHFYHNIFNELRVDAFFGITGLGNINSFNFTGNALKIVHNGSLNPNKAVSKNDALLANSFLNCTSSNIGWIWEAAFGSYVSTNTKEYYQMLLSHENCNICYNYLEDPERQTCFLENVTMMYDPQNLDNKIMKFFNGSVNNDKICHFLINSSIMLEPTVILFVQIVCFYLVAFLIH